MILLVVLWQVLGRVDALRKKITSVGKQHASVCAKVSVDADLVGQSHLHLLKPNIILSLIIQRKGNGMLRKSTTKIQ